MTSKQLTIGRLLRQFRTLWKPLALSYFIYGIVAFVILGPLVTLVVRLGVTMSGAEALKDQDIVFFALHPVGLVVSVLLIALILTVSALQSAALMTVIFGSSHDIAVHATEALRFCAFRSWRVLLLAVRVVGWTLAIALPFLAIVAVVYLLLLTQFDINFYLKQRPPEFWLAVSIAAIVLGAMLIVLLMKFASWAFALPALLFDDVTDARALAASKRATRGHRVRIVVWLFSWLLVAVLLSAISALVVKWFGETSVSLAGQSLILLTLCAGTVLVVSSVLYLAVSFFSASMLCLIIVGLYRAAGQGNADIVKTIGQTTSDQPFGLFRTDRNLLTYGLVAAAVAAVAGWLVISSLRLTDEVQIHAHRGASLMAPENTMAAIERAIELGADWVEIDVYETIDGQIIVIHDSDLKRVGGVDVRVGQSTYDQLKDIDVGSWFAADFHDQRIPKLEQVLEFCRGKIGVNIELKYHGNETRLEERVAELVDQAEMASRVVVMSLKYDGLKAMRQVRPEYKIGLLQSVSVGDVSKFDVDFFAVNAEFVTDSFIHRAHRSGRDVFVWTVNDAVSMSTLISRGVDGIITDDPEIAAAVMQYRAELSAPERLLLELATFFGHRPRISDQ